MSKSKYINLIMGGSKNNLFRGINLGDPIELVLQKETGEMEHRADVMYFYRFFYKLDASKDTEYEVAYYYDSDRKVDNISCRTEYNIYNDTNIPQKDFETLIDEFNEYFGKKYGEPKVKENTFGEDKEIIKSWISNSNLENSIEILLTYDNNKEDGLLHAIGIEFHYHYD